MHLSRNLVAFTAALLALAGCSAPGVPTNVTATAGNQQATVAWSAPASKGSSSISSYKITASPGGATVSTLGPLTATMTGLTNGTGYVFTVVATNGNGSSRASLPSNVVVPAAVPAAPTGVSATAGDASAMVMWTPVTTTNGSPITSYTVTASPGGQQVTTSDNDSATVTGLTNGTSYSFTVHATNAAGSGSESLASNPVTPAAATTVPGAPSNVIAVAANAQVSLSWTAPASTGGIPITSYVVTTDPGDATMNISSGATSTLITGLTNGTSYAFSVHALNELGAGPESLPSNIVVPGDVPGAPVDVVATPGDSQITVAWGTPASDGGSPITMYTVVANPGSITIQTTDTEALFTGLTNGTPYTFTVTATNAVGPGPSSSPATPVIPAGVPSAPVAVVAVAGAQSAALSWEPPLSDGGSALTGYIVTVSPGNTTVMTSGETIATVTGLTNGTTYVFLVQAVNAIGPGPSSGPSNAVVPASAPAATTTVTAVAGDEQATVSWNPAATDGAAVTGYTVMGTPGDEIVTTTGATSAVVPSLTNGVTYTFTVSATNAIGTGPQSGPSNPVTPRGLPNAGTSMLQATPSSTFVGETVIIKLTARDAAGDPLSGWPVTFSASSGGSLAPGQGNTNASGAFQTILTTSAAGIITVSAIVGSLETSISVKVQTTPACTGALTFPTPPAANTGNAPVAAAEADFNGDGNPDVVAYNQGDGTISILLGNGHDSFANATTAPLAASTSTVMRAEVISAEKVLVNNAGWTIAVTDLNGDGNSDVVVPDSESSVDVFLGNGDGTFQPAVSYPTDSEPEAVVIADFNGDSIPDIASVNNDADDVVILLGNGDGTFNVTGATYPVGDLPTAAVAGDFNGDGFMDLVVTASNDDQIDVLLGNGDGTLQSYYTYPVYGEPVALVASDFNGDGHLDLGVTLNDQAEVQILNGNGDGSFQFGTSTTYSVGSAPVWIGTGDFNGDRITDLAITNSSDGTATILLGNGDGTFQVTLSAFATGDQPFAAALGDFNKDGKLDLVSANLDDDTIQVLSGTGTGALTDISIPAQQIVPTSVVEADLNADGFPDIVVADLGNVVVDVLYGNGNGTFQAPLVIEADDAPAAVAVADFNGDGLLDIAVADVEDGDIAVFVANGQGGFSRGATLSTGDGPTALLTADFNLDGFADLAVVNGGDGDVGVFVSQGRALVSSGGPLKPLAMPQTVVASDSGLDAFASADLNGDGRPDIAFTTTNGVDVILGNGDGTFGDIAALAAGAWPTWIGIADMNGDGKLDLVLTSHEANVSSGGQLSVLLGTGSGTFQMPTETIVTPALGPAAIADFDGDGHLDVVSASFGVQVFLIRGVGNGTFHPVVPYLGGDSVGPSQSGARPAMIKRGAPVSCVSRLAGVGIGCITDGVNTLVAGDINLDGTVDIVAGGYVNVGLMLNECSP